MDDIASRVAYLRGLANGIPRDEMGAAGPILSGILDVLDEFAGSLDRVASRQEDLAEQVADLEDAGGVEEYEVWEDAPLLGGGAAPGAREEPGEGAVPHGPWWTFDCPGCGARLEVPDDAFDDDEHIELVCPDCGTLIHDDDPDLVAAPDDEEA